MGSRQSFATPHSRVPSAMIGQYTLKQNTHSNRDTGFEKTDDHLIIYKQKRRKKQPNRLEYNGKEK